MIPIYVQAETREMLRALAAPGENFDELLQRLVEELHELRREREPAPAPPVADALGAVGPPDAAAAGP